MLSEVVALPGVVWGCWSSQSHHIHRCSPELTRTAKEMVGESEGGRVEGGREGESERGWEGGGRVGRGREGGRERGNHTGVITRPVL